MYEVTSDSFLSEKFLTEYFNLVPKYKGELFEITYLEKYSQWRQDLQRREFWRETIQRVVEHSMSLYQGPATKQDLIKEAEELYDRIFHLKLLPAGRALWLAGTKASYALPDALFNCTYSNIETLEDICEGFHLLLCGCGFGFSVERKYISKLPQVFGKKLEHEPYNGLHPEDRAESTICSLSEGHLHIHVGDSKEGWVMALRQFLAVCEMPEVTKVSINYDSIRPKGERIKTFGGYAPGHTGLQSMFEEINSLFFRVHKLNSVDVVDVMNFIALNTLTGGNRRAAENALGDRDDIYFIEAKFGNNIPIQRQMSNNSVLYYEKPSKQELKEIFQRIRHSGEPGFANMQAASLRRPNMTGFNPCYEILMDSKAVCNLSTVVMTSHIVKGGLDMPDLLRSVELATRVGMRMTNVTLSIPAWDKIQKRDRLTGVSLTAFMDALDVLDLDMFGKAKSLVEFILQNLRTKANTVADKYAYEMRIPRPLLVTALKPEGTVSQLVTKSAGLHRGYAEYYLRTFRMSEVSPVARALMSLGMPSINDPKKPGRKIFRFPIHSKSRMLATEESTVHQYTRYLTFQERYTDHNSSCTLTINPEEEDEIIDMLDKNWHNTVACAWMPKIILDPKIYPYLPYEAISKEEFETLSIQQPDLTNLVELVNKFEKIEFVDEEAEAEKDPSCAGGACPLR